MRLSDILKLNEYKERKLFSEIIKECNQNLKSLHSENMINYTSKDFEFKLLHPWKQTVLQRILKESHNIHISSLSASEKISKLKGLQTEERSHMEKHSTRS